MSKSIQSKIGRRDFLKDSATAAVAVSCLSLDLRRAVAQARKEGKPVLTENNLNAFIRANRPDKEKARQLAQEAANDPKGFIRRRFYLTSTQESELDLIGTEEIEKIREILGRVIDENAQLRINIKAKVRPANVPEEKTSFAAAGPNVIAPKVETGCEIETNPRTGETTVKCHITASK